MVTQTNVGKKAEAESTYVAPQENPDPDKPKQETATDADITVFTRREVKGYNGGGDAEMRERKLLMYPSVDAVDGFSKVYYTDAHFAPYIGYEKASNTYLDSLPRVNKQGLPRWRADGGEIYLTLFVVDVDDPEKIDGKYARPEWRKEMEDNIAKLPSDLQFTVYDTRGGVRLVARPTRWMLPEESEATWPTLAARLAEYGITADPNCKDWTRLYRLPNVKRDGKLAVVDTEWPLDRIPTCEIPILKASPRQALTLAERLAMETSVGTLIQPSYPDGTRHDEYKKLAATFRSMGHDVADIEKLIHAINDTYGDPPMQDDRWIESIAVWAGDNVVPGPLVGVVQPVDEGESTASPTAALEPVPAPDPEAFDDPLDVSRDLEKAWGTGDHHELAEWIGNKLGRRGPLVATRGNIWQYDQRKGTFFVHRRQVLHKLLEQFAGTRIHSPSPKNPGRTVPLRLTMNLANGVIDWMLASRDEPRFFDDASDGVCFNNGFVHLQRSTGDSASCWSIALEDHSPDHRQQHALDFDFDPNCVLPPQTTAAMRRWFPKDVCPDQDQLIQAAYEVIGIALLGKGTTLQQAVFLTGSGSNGKSTFMKILAALVPKTGLRSIPPQDMRQEYRRAHLASCLVNLVSELPEKELMSSSAFKGFVTGDLMNGRFIRRPVFYFVPVALHVLAANTLPRVNDFTHGFWRRVFALPFKGVIPVEERIDNYEEVLLGKERAQIASYAIKCAVDALRRRRFLEDVSSTSEKAAWRLDCDRVAMFVREELVPCKRTDVGALGRRDMYDLFVRHARDNNYRVMGKNTFNKRMADLGYHAKKTSGQKGRYTYALRVVGSPLTRSCA